MSLPPGARTEPPTRGLLLAVLAVVAFSTSPILARWAANDLSAYEVTTGRLLIAGVVIGGVAWVRREPLPPRDAWLRYVGYGLVAALHFVCYIAALNFTTIAHALAITYTAPVFVALLAGRALGERLTARQWMGIGVAVLGVAVLAGFEPTMTPRMWIGDLLALGSAVCFALYSIAGRSQRDRTGLFAYAATVYTLAGLWLLPVAVAVASPAGYTPIAVGSVVALGLVPLAVGHTLYNAALRRTRATTVNLIATQEVTGGILLGIALLGEMPTLTSWWGVGITLLGIALVIR